MSKNTDLANYDTVLPVANVNSSNTLTVGNVVLTNNSITIANSAVATLVQVLTYNLAF